MLRLYTLLTTAIGICIARPSVARPHYNAWFRTTLSVPAGSKIKADVELQHRRQSGFKNNDPLGKNLMFSFRNWIHYQYSNNVKLSISPFAYFSSYKIIQKQQDESFKPNSEIRFSAAAEIQHDMSQRFFIVNRMALEYRMLENSTDIWRLRNRLGLQYKVSPMLKLGMQEELVLNVAGTDIEHFYDHNRMAIDIEYSISDKLKINIGYMYIIRLPLTHTNTLDEHDIFINVAYQLFRRHPKMYDISLPARKN